MRKIIYILLLLNCITLFSQEKDKNLYNGNQSFTEKKYTDAEAEYRVTQSKKGPKKAVAGYNLGNSVYRQNQQGEAKIKYIQALETAKTKTEKHRIYHNLGNTFMLEKNYEAAAEAYKNALRNNPNDEETRYNYALAKRKKKENPPPPPPKDKKNNKGGGGQDNKPQPKDKGNDKKDSDKDNQNNNDKQDNNQQGKGDGDKKEDKNENPKPSGADKQRIDNILDAVNNAEKKVQDKVNAKKVKARPVSNEKDW
ncbi:tetratricopeptide repeat protein [Flavobacterium lacisediminis]|uniref:Tetratricopeptide repeat protein n=1 Tax=Flavobacterium lacisediminis TaxID=2989705 RepID=A0ABT3EEY7_9FLAO|nr:tetratricopeptide repeat protein [Flavobacterium lacisediminis]MCW1146994.1 tetratricopeptide repeat protein [Flavobacterium lacisediminis]